MRTVCVHWLESPNYVVSYQREKPGLVLTADDKVGGVKAPSESITGFSLPMFGIPDPRFDHDFRKMLAVRVQMLVSYAFKQGLLDAVTFFGAIHDYHQNIMLGIGYSTVKVLPRFRHTPTGLFEVLHSEFEVDLEAILGPSFKPPTKKLRHERPWVI